MLMLILYVLGFVCMFVSLLLASFSSADSISLLDLIATPFLGFIGAFFWPIIFVLLLTENADNIIIWRRKNETK